VVIADRPDHETVVLLLAYTGLPWGEMRPSVRSQKIEGKNEAKGLINEEDPVSGRECRFRVNADPGVPVES
jgi:hypothetical protein